VPKIGAASATAAAAGGPVDNAKIEKSATSDWGLSLKKPRRSARFKIAAGVLLVFSAAGGYAAYTRFAGKDLAAEAGAEDAADKGAEIARANENGAIDADAELPGGGDPFDERPEVKPIANSRAPANSEPRRVGNIPDAMPIASRNARGSVSKKKPLHDSLELDDEMPDNADDDADGRARDQSEPDPGDDASGPSLGETADVPRRLPAAGRGDSNGSRSGAERHLSSGPRSSTRNREADPSDSLSDEKLEDYRVAGKRTAGKSKGNSGGPSISIVEAHDDLQND
jgi:hypothetical protein